jgi:tRNA-dihydrouridine synthase
MSSNSVEAATSASAAVPRQPKFASYKGAVMAAPMVRVSSLPFRLQCARYGADFVFSEELIAAKLSRCVREVVDLPDVSQDLICGAQVTAMPPIPPPVPADGATSPTGDAPPAAAADGRLFTEAAAMAPTPQRRRVVQFVHYNQYGQGFKRSVVWQTFERASPDDTPEGAPVILQMGVADPESGAKAAAVFKDDVDGFDVNMGCPKAFSVKNRMGATLMTDTDRAIKILQAIKAAAPDVPLSFKTRVFDDVETSVEHLTTVLAAVDVHSVSLHARTRELRSEKAPLYELAGAVIAAVRQRYPAICYSLNGSLGCSGLHHLDGESRDVAQRAKASLVKQHVEVAAAAGEECPARVAVPTEWRRVPHDVTLGGTGWQGKAEMLATARAHGFDAAMVARDAMWNPSVFAPYRPEHTTAAAHALVADGAPPAAVVTPFATFDADYCAVHRRLVLEHVMYGTSFSFIKYHLTRSFQEWIYPSTSGRFLHYKAVHDALLKGKSFADACVAIGFTQDAAAALRQAHFATEGHRPPEAAADGIASGAPVPFKELFDPRKRARDPTAVTAVAAVPNE